MTAISAESLSRCAVFSLVTKQTEGDGFRAILLGNMDRGKQERRVAGRGRMHGRQRRGGPRAAVSDEMRAKIIDPVVNHGLLVQGCNQNLPFPQ